jgi:hypothetical protein
MLLRERENQNKQFQGVTVSKVVDGRIEVNKLFFFISPVFIRYIG